MYRPDFDQKIRKAAPQWFATKKRSEPIAKKQRSSDLKRGQLLALARSGVPRPKFKTSLGLALSNYTRRKSRLYNLKFDREIRGIVPGWFTASEDQGEQRREILALLRSSERLSHHSSDPHERHLADALRRKYANPKSRSYDQTIEREAQRLVSRKNPHAKKAELLAMARCGKPRPSQTARDPHEHSLASALSYFTRNTSVMFDPDFYQELRRLAPHWFSKPKETP